MERSNLCIWFGSWELECLSWIWELFVPELVSDELWNQEESTHLGRKGFEYITGYIWQWRVGRVGGETWHTPTGDS